MFSTILKREDGKHFLVTPVEKVGIRVDDAPFLAVEMIKEQGEEGRSLRFRTNVDDWVDCDGAHPLRFEASAEGGLTPYLHVRADLWAKVTRALYYDLVDIGEERMVDGRQMFGVASAGAFFAMADAEEVRGCILSEAMAKNDPAAISSAEFFDRARARLRFEIPAGLTDPSLIPASGDQGTDRMLADSSRANSRSVPRQS